MLWAERSEGEEEARKVPAYPLWLVIMLNLKYAHKLANDTFCWDIFIRNEMKVQGHGNVLECEVGMSGGIDKDQVWERRHQFGNLALKTDDSYFLISQKQLFPFTTSEEQNMVQI